MKKVPANMVGVIGVAAVVAVLVTGCGEGSEPDELTDNWLSRAISLILAEHGSEYVYFANYAEARKAAGADEFRGGLYIWEDVPAPISPSTGRPPWVREEIDPSVPWTYALMPPSYMNIRTYSKRFYKGMGLDFFLLDEMVGVDSFDRDSFTFMAVNGEGVNHVTLPDIIQEMGYYSSTHRGLRYYQWFADDQNMDSRRSRDHPMGRMMASMFALRALAVLGDQLIFVEKTVDLLEVLDVHEGARASLSDQKPYRELARVAGPDLLGGAFLAPEFIYHIWDKDGRKPPNSLDHYISGESKWGVMDPYNAAVVGAGVVDGQAHMMVGLHFSSQEAAEKSVNELIHRWSTARLKLAMPYTAFELDRPFGAYCAPIDARAVALEDASVLIAKCPIFSYNSSKHGEVVPADGFWAMVVEGQELHFLLPDPEEAAHRLKSKD